MYQVPPQQSHTGAGPIASLLIVILTVVVLALSLPALGRSGGVPADRPLHAPVGLDL